MRIYLEFTPESLPIHRARITYAFRLFCAIYGHTPLLGNEPCGSADLRIRYFTRRKGPRKSDRILELSNLYLPRPIHEPAPSPRGYVRDGEATALFYLPLPGQEPDWFGEIFEWVSCADEYSVAKLDSVGRVPFEATSAGQAHLHVQVPYAAVAMRLLQLAICRLLPGVSEEPTCPIESKSHFIIPSHDVDYLHVSRLGSMYRLAKNAAISSLVSKAPTLGMRQARMALETGLGEQDPLDRVTWLAEEEARRGVIASYYFILGRGHRRDADYAHNLGRVSDLIRTLEACGIETGVHGSYTCLDTPEGLSLEYGRMRALGFQPQGGRQHWLRYTPDRLIPALETAGALYDSSFGWPDRIGFRAGACFAFPPYYFQEERPATFLEIPMLMMDQAFQEGLGVESQGYDEAADLLATSRKYVWGGVSLLWHPAAFGGGWLSPEVGDIYWRLMDQRDHWGDSWLSGSNFLQLVRQRYVDVGLLPTSDATSRPKFQGSQSSSVEMVSA